MKTDVYLAGGGPVNRELWDAWACRFAGGAPIDG